MLKRAEERDRERESFLLSAGCVGGVKTTFTRRATSASGGCFFSSSHSFCSFKLQVVFFLWCSNFSTADYYPSDVAVSLNATRKAGLEFSFWSRIHTASKSEGDFLCHHFFFSSFFFSMWSWSWKPQEQRRRKTTRRCVQVLSESHSLLCPTRFHLCANVK